MNRTVPQRPTEAPSKGIILVVDEDIRRLRRIEFILRMADYQVQTLRGNHEAANWLLNHSSVQVAALVLIPTLTPVQNPAVEVFIPSHLCVPVIFIESANQSVFGNYIDMVYGGSRWSAKTTEPFLLDALHKIFKMSPRPAAESAEPAKGMIDDELRTDGDVPQRSKFTVGE